MLLISLIYLFFLGIFPLLAPDVFADFLNFNRHDQYIFQILGAAALSFSIIMVKIVYENTPWYKVQSIIVSLFIIHIFSIYACVRALLRPYAPQYFIYIVLAFSLVTIFLTLKQVLQYKISWNGKMNLSSVSVISLVVISIVSLALSLSMIVPKAYFLLLGKTATDAFIYRETAAMIMGFIPLGVFAFLRRFEQVELPVFGSIIFYALLFFITIIEVIKKGNTIVFDVVLILSLIFSISLAILYHKKKTMD